MQMELGAGLARARPLGMGVAQRHFLARPEERIWQRMPDEGFVRFGATVFAMRAESNSSQPAAPDRVVSTPAEAASTPATDRLAIRLALKTACPHCAGASVNR